MHGLEPASYTFYWESRSGSQFQAHPSSPTQGLIETWESAPPILATRAEERNPLFKFPVRFFSHGWHWKWKADKVWYAVWFPSSSQIRKTCICSSALPQLTSPELVSEIWRPGLPIGCLMQADLSPPPGCLWVSWRCCWAELSWVGTAPGPQTCRWYIMLYGCHICFFHILDFFHSSEEETLIHPMQSTHSLCLELSNKGICECSGPTVLPHLFPVP